MRIACENNHAFTQELPPVDGVGEHLFVASCGRCGQPFFAPPAMLALSQPAVVEVRS